MSEDRLILAIGRLERGLARVEAAASHPTQMTPAENPEREVAFNALAQRHDQLKNRVEAAVAALDGIIAKG